MDFVDYYGILGVPKDAQIKEIQRAFDAFIENPDSDRFDVSMRAYKTLINPYKRARYNKIYGHLMFIEANSQEYLNAVHYRLNSIQPHAAMNALIEKFKSWIEKKYDFDWKEAQLAHYSYYLENKGKDLWLLLRFPTLSNLESFAKSLLRLKLIKAIS